MPQSKFMHAMYYVPFVCFIIYIIEIWLFFFNSELQDEVSNVINDLIFF